MSNILKTITDAPLGGEPFIQTSGSLLVSLIVTIFLAALMMLIYRLCHDSMTYNNKFNITLMMLSVASTTLLALIQNNPLFSLGALGALSICRIRTNTKDPRDLGFVFWSLAIGISSALGAFAVGLISSAVLSSVMLLMNGRTKKADAVTIVIRGKKERMEDVQEVLGQTKGSSIQSKNLFPDSFELVYELKIPQKEEEILLTIFNNMDGINGVNVLAPKTKVA